MALHVVRVYDAERAVGHRVLVDRLWPRGIRKEVVDTWLKEVAPSTGLRRWFDHVPERYPEFVRRYREELAGSTALAELRRIVAEHEDVTLLYSARDTEHNQAVVLADYLRD